MEKRFPAVRLLRRLLPPMAMLLAVWGATPARQALAKMSVLSSPHNLSASGGAPRSSGQPSASFIEERRVCVFCHVPHKGTTGTPLWSRPLPPESTPYQLYESSTASATRVTGRPTGSSRLCLSCHDGTIALGQYVGSPIVGQALMPSGGAPAANANLTVDLRDDHPISIEYTEALALKSHLASPSALGGGVRLERGLVLQCTACHDPHDNQYGNFLVMNNSSPDRPDYAPGSPLCVACHRPQGWDGATHNPAQTATLVNACMNCHAVHNAPGAVRLLKGAKLSDGCYQSCHNGTGSGSNVKTLFDPGMHRHPVGDTASGKVHDAKEKLPAETYHVECADCHNPHELNGAGAPLSAPPQANGRLKGVRMNDLGESATREFDVCFRCHSGANASKFAGIGEVKTIRMISEPDQANRFDFQNPSFHPVSADRRTSGASLVADLQQGMIRIYCSDCHNNNQGSKAGGTGPNGPHGSQYPHILIAQYDMPSFGEVRPGYNMTQYSLCFRCHAEQYVMESGSAFTNVGENQHATHVRDRLIPCFACHDPHGVPWKTGGTAANNAHLINFEKDYASGPAVPSPFYSTPVTGAGNCTVDCHTNPGNNHAYAASAAKRLLLLKGNTPFRTR